MALVATTLNGAITSTAKTLKLTSATGATVGMFIQVDSEFCLVQDISNTPTLQVARGQLGTVAAAHNTLAQVAFGVASDFQQSTAPPAQIFTGVFPTVEYGAAGAIAVPVINTYVSLKS